MSTTATTRKEQRSTFTPTLFVAFELGEGRWKLGATPGVGRKPRERNVAARDGKAVLTEIARAKQRLGVPEDARVVSCYEAGRDGFWLHRFLVAHGIENRVVDSASIEVNRRQRRAKTDRMDVRKLLGLLLREQAGDRHVWRVVRVPSRTEEDGRQLHRERQTLQRERARVTNRIKGLLATQGCTIGLRRDVAAQLACLTLWDGSPLPPGLRARLEREWEKVQFLTRQIAGLDAERQQLLRTANTAAVQQVRQLSKLRGIGPNSAWLYVMEFFGWRAFRNGKEIGSLAGLTPTPHQSGKLRRELGINKAGNRHVRGMAIEIAWGWLRYQPQSALARWYQRRFGHGSARLRKIGIVALARKLLIALWRFLESGTPPDGAALKAVPCSR
jgi:transposase